MKDLQTEDIKPKIVYEELVTVDAFIMPYEADIARSLLESQDIPSFLMDYGTIYLDWLYSLALKGIKLQVRQSDFEQASEVLRNASLHGSSEEIESSEGACPRCGGIKTKPVVLGRGWAILTWYLLGIPLIWPWIRLRCSECGHKWRDKP